MKKTEAVVGLRVAEKVTQYYEGDEPRPGTIVAGPAPAGHVLVEWDLYEYQKRANEKPVATPVAFKNLLPLKEAEAQFNKLESEFKAVEKQVLSKMKEAAKLIREANSLAKKAGVEDLNEMHNATYPLYNVMDACGWNTSSWGC